MTTILHAAAWLNAIAAGAASLWAAAGELVTAASLLWCLNQLATLIERTYHAGVVTGRFYWRHLHPALLAAADGISWIHAQIDWAEVRAIVIAGSRLCLAAVITTAVMAHHLLIVCSEQLGKAVSSRLAPAAATPVVPAPVVPAPVVPAPVVPAPVASAPVVPAPVVPAPVVPAPVVPAPVVPAPLASAPVEPAPVASKRRTARNAAASTASGKRRALAAA
jgi:hypothetical protein